MPRTISVNCHTINYDENNFFEWHFFSFYGKSQWQHLETGKCSLSFLFIQQHIYLMLQAAIYLCRNNNSRTGENCVYFCINFTFFFIIKSRINRCIVFSSCLITCKKRVFNMKKKSTQFSANK